MAHNAAMSVLTFFTGEKKLALDDEKALSLVTAKRDALLQQAKTLQISTSSDLSLIHI